MVDGFALRDGRCIVKKAVNEADGEKRLTMTCLDVNVGDDKVEPVAY